MDRTMKERHDAAQFVAFRLNDEEFAIGIQQVKEVLRLMPITPLPHSAEFIEGVINIRGAVLPVIDLRRRFEFASVDTTDLTRIIIVDIMDDQMGLIVDEVTEVLRVQVDEIQPAPRKASNGREEVLESLARVRDRLIMILNIDRLLTSSELVTVDEAQVEEAGL